MLLKLWTLLLPYMLIICQTYISEGAPFRSSKESMLDGVSLFNDDTQKLFKVIKELMQRSLDEQELSMTEGYSLDRPITKRCTSLSTCVLGKLSQDIHRLQTFPRTDVGAGTPGKK